MLQRILCLNRFLSEGLSWLGSRWAWTWTGQIWGSDQATDDMQSFCLGIRKCLESKERFTNVYPEQWTLDNWWELLAGHLLRKVDGGR